MSYGDKQADGDDDVVLFVEAVGREGSRRDRCRGPRLRAWRGRDARAAGDPEGDPRRSCAPASLRRPPAGEPSWYLVTLSGPPGNLARALTSTDYLPTPFEYSVPTPQH